jgi:hypothetical protein
MRQMTSDQDASESRDLKSCDLVIIPKIIPISGVVFQSIDGASVE